ncbi:PII family protein [Carboxydothermus islandicus]|uniref:PII family protein n=1 Tax=Carboxydothermus islandicus TaxID=661089 RepID=A0A1L8D5E3_9THEO|nr:P-II family nitrogen regulator [Carboxydothermus islandicus]GAV26334.1 PII family protein [Carboxydothermus islandicus]
MSKILNKCKLIIAIVNYGVARKVVKASKESGADGATTIMGKGIGIHERMTFFGIPVEAEKEIIFTLIREEELDTVFQTIISSAQLNKPGQGIALIIDVQEVAGICHMCIPAETKKKSFGRIEMENNGEILYDLIITIVNKGDAEKVVESSKRAGAEGGTIISGRGTGIHEHAKLFGITIEPEKEIVLTLIERQKTKRVLEAIVNETDLNKPGKGIAFVLAVEKVAGINHLFKRE